MLADSGSAETANACSPMRSVSSPALTTTSTAPPPGVRSEPCAGITPTACGHTPPCSGVSSVHSPGRSPMRSRRTSPTLRSVTYSVPSSTASPCGRPPSSTVCTAPLSSSTIASMPCCSSEDTMRPSASRTSSCGPPGSAMRRLSAATEGRERSTTTSAWPRRSAITSCPRGLGSLPEEPPAVARNERTAISAPPPSTSSRSRVRPRIDVTPRCRCAGRPAGVPRARGRAPCG